MDNSQSVLALIALFTTVTTAVFGAMTWAQKTMVAVLQEAIKNEREDKKLLTADNREQAATISRMGASVDKLTDQVAILARLVEDLVYDRDATQRRRSGD